METKFSEHIFNKGNEYSKENNFKLAIASYSWAIAFNKDFLDTSVRPKFSFSFKAPINYKLKYLNKRGQEYLKNHLYLQAIDDFKRSINIDPGRNAEAFSGWQHAYYDYKIHPSHFFTHLDLFYDNYREAYNYPKDWPKNSKPKPDSRHVFEDIWIAVNAGGTKKAIDYSNAGLRSAIYGNWEDTLNNFLLAIDTDLFFAETFAGNEYNQAITDIKSALRCDIDKIIKSRKQYTLSLGNCIHTFIDKHENSVKPQHSNNVIIDNFYLDLQEFVESNGREVFLNKCFYGTFSDYINGEHKKDMVLLKKIIDIDFLDISKKLSKFECEGKHDLNRMIDIIYFLLVLLIKGNKKYN